MAPEYVTVYQISKRPPIVSFALAGAFPSSSSLSSSWVSDRFKGEASRNQKIGGLLSCQFSPVASGSFGFARRAYPFLHEDSQALTRTKGDFSTREGIVTTSIQCLMKGHQDECFSCSGQTLLLFRYAIAPGFRNTDRMVADSLDCQSE